MINIGTGFHRQPRAARDSRWPRPLVNGKRAHCIDRYAQAELDIYVTASVRFFLALGTPNVFYTYTLVAAISLFHLHFPVSRRAGQKKNRCSLQGSCFGRQFTSSTNVLCFTVAIAHRCHRTLFSGKSICHSRHPSLRPASPLYSFHSVRVVVGPVLLYRCGTGSFSPHSLL